MKNNLPTPSNHTKTSLPTSQPGYYEIRIKGLIEPGWDWLEDLVLTHLESGDTLLCGPIIDQAALHGLLARIRDLNLTLMAVNRIDPAE